MENSLLIGLSRQMALHREMDVVANNIANISTTGFKADAAIFEEFLPSGAQHGHFTGADRRLSYVQDRATWHDFKQGPIRQTGSALDVAIEGDAFLVVQTPRGERYTRNGALQINSQGQLVTTEGYQVQGETGPIVFQQLDRDVSISPDGRITVMEGNSRQESLRGKLRVVSFAQPGQLLKDGSSTFSAPAGLAAQPLTNVRLLQGALERSNVKSVVEMTRMVELTRTYTQIASILQQQSDLRKAAIAQLAEVPN
jgi:flagellar basal-body rod protein FlgF/flagellar basal-body rod protein FlgG